ncbi:TPA: hypothetical protein KRI64_004198, partial [Clostridioides difficile]|nr:hypothetical protein [Clostridioides difficile]HBG8933152.1 hypothetical protein [Clostridioides difficile]
FTTGCPTCYCNLRVQILCKNGRIKGVERIGRSWIIPLIAEKPADERIKSGKYVNWRYSDIDSKG